MKELISQKKIDFWIQHQVNVMLIGKHGIGKTHIAMDAAKKAGLKFQYFSCATLDPWVDFIGVPKVRTTTVNGKKKSYLDLVRPKAFAFDEVEFLMLDELNRADPKVMNAVLELIQFRSINGKKFKNLKCIWAAINPPASETGDVAYHVQELDPALMSRFHVRIELPFEPAENYFVEKFGKDLGRNACSWWMSLKEKAKDDFPPRSMDYALTYIKKGGDVADVLPKSVSKDEFIRILDKDFSAEDLDNAYDSVAPTNAALDMQLLRNIRYASSISVAGPHIQRLRKGSAEEITALALNAMEQGSTRENARMTMTLIASLQPNRRDRLLSTLYTAFIASADDEGSSEPVESTLEFTEAQFQTMTKIVNALEGLEAEFKYRSKTKSFDLVSINADGLTPCDNSNDTANQMLSKLHSRNMKGTN